MKRPNLMVLIMVGLIATIFTGCSVILVTPTATPDNVNYWHPTPQSYWYPSYAPHPHSWFWGYGWHDPWTGQRRHHQSYNPWHNQPRDHHPGHH